MYNMKRFLNRSFISYASIYILSFIMRNTIELVVIQANYALGNILYYCTQLCTLWEKFRKCLCRVFNDKSLSFVLVKAGPLCPLRWWASHCSAASYFKEAIIGNIIVRVIVELCRLTMASNGCFALEILSVSEMLSRA